MDEWEKIPVQILGLINIYLLVTFFRKSLSSCSKFLQLLWGLLFFPKGFFVINHVFLSIVVENKIPEYHKYVHSALIFRCLHFFILKHDVVVAYMSVYPQHITVKINNLLTANQNKITCLNNLKPWLICRSSGDWTQSILTCIRQWAVRIAWPSR